MVEILKTPVGRTKNQIWESYKELLALQNENAKNTPASTVQQEKVQKIAKSLEIADNSGSYDIEAELTRMAGNIREAKDAYEQIKYAIRQKEEQLKQVHAIEVEANAIEALIALKEKVLTEKEQLAKEIIETAEKQANDLRETVQEEVENARRAESQKKDEWEFFFNKKKRDDLDALQETLKNYRISLGERESKIAERELAVDTLQTEIDNLKAQIVAITSNYDRDIQKACEEASNKTKEGARIAASFEKRAHDSEIAIRDAKNEMLQNRINELTKALTDEQAKVALANKQLTDIAQSSLSASADKQTIAQIAMLQNSSTTRK